jgi:pyroglutamyl-peptidase
MKILVTGFEPFGESDLNPSQMLIKLLSGNSLNGASLILDVLPVDQANAPERMISLIHQHHPEAVLAFGLAMGRPKISLERVALNLQDFRIPDNQGVTIKNQHIQPEGPAAYFSTLPLEEMLNALLKEGIPAALSLSAGAYLCNLVFYTMLHTLADLSLKSPAGFVHLPALPEQAAASIKPIPSLDLELQQSAARILIKTLVDNNNHNIRRRGEA